MNISEMKEYLGTVEHPKFVLPDGEIVPPHYHITEIGLVQKQYIDCGGEMRHEQRISFQIWTADDSDHRLTSQKLLDIITQFESTISSIDTSIEIEYQGATIGKYGVQAYENGLLLTPTHTDCLAKDACKIPVTTQGGACCGGGCC